VRPLRLFLFALLLALAGILVWRALLPDYGSMSDAERLDKVLTMYRDYARNFPKVEGISAKEALAAYEEGKAVFVDVRAPAERAVSIIPGAITTEDLLAARTADPAAYAGKTIIVYCTISYRSGVLAEEWVERGGPSARNLEGGLLGWLHAGGPLIKPDGTPTKRAHVFGATWDLAPHGIATVY